jgi:tetratricopeptide (TPR) repeat protein
LFEDTRTGYKAPVAGSDLAAQFDRLSRGHRPGLVILAACRSARTDESAEPLSNVAARLHTRGCERVLGMRLSVLDDAVSAFDAVLFKRLARGEDVGRAVTLARQAVAQGTWWQALAGHNGSHGDPWAQWSLPVLLDRTQDGPLVDVHSPVEPPPPRGRPTMLIDDGTIFLPDRKACIGRRWEKRQYLRAFLEGDRRGLLFTGPGGVGKTTLAGLFARALSERQPEIRLLGFWAPFKLDKLYEPLRCEAFDGTEEPTLLPAIQTEPDLRERLRRLRQSLAQRRGRPCAFVLDNLEAIQDLASLTVATTQEGEESFWFLRQVCALPAPTRMLLTGRYPVPDLSDGVVSLCPVRDAPYGDVLQRMLRLAWPPTMSKAQKRQMYKVLGGNHRAIEWSAQVLKQEHQQAAELVTALAALHAPPKTPAEAVHVVVEAMRQNLLFTRLRDLLTPTQDHLLRAASLYRKPVNVDGLLALTVQPEQCDEDWQRLVTYALLEGSHDAELDLDYFRVPPVVCALLSDHGFSPVELQALHRAMGRYHRFHGEHVSGEHVSRRLIDNSEAIYHFRQAGEHAAADEMAWGVCNFYYSLGNYTAARALTEEIVQRTSPSPPWWALQLHGLCQMTLGLRESALGVLQRALSIVTTSVEEGATLANLGQLYAAWEDYDRALGYLEQSLAIRRAIGDKAEEGATLIFLGLIYKERGDYDRALGYLEQSLVIHRDIGDKEVQVETLHTMGRIAWEADNVERAVTLWSEAFTIAKETQSATGLFLMAGTLGQALAVTGELGQARQLLQLAVEIGKAAGFPEVQDYEELLRRLPSAEV